MQVVEIIVAVLQVIASLVLIAVIMFQSGKESGLSGALSGNADNYLGKSNKKNLDQVLASATKWIAAVWVILTLVLSLI